MSCGLHYEAHQAYSGSDYPYVQTQEQLFAQGKTVADAFRTIEVMQPTYHRKRQQYDGSRAEDSRRLTHLRKVNASLKVLLAEAELDRAMLKELVAL